MKTNKYTYYKVIQTNSGYGWNDDDFHETNSFFELKNRYAYFTNLKAYRENFKGDIRVINRKELNERKAA
jgi:hypothetical protein